MFVALERVTVAEIFAIQMLEWDSTSSSFATTASHIQAQQISAYPPIGLYSFADQWSRCILNHLTSLLVCRENLEFLLEVVMV